MIFRPVRPASPWGPHHKATRGIDKHLGFLCPQLPGDDRFNDVLVQVPGNGGLIHVGMVLRGNYHIIHGDGAVLFIVNNGDLSFTIGPQVGHDPVCARPPGA